MSNKLVDYINLVPDEREYIISKSLCLTYGQIKKKIRDFSISNENLRGRNCAIVSDSRLSLSVYLPCLENLTTSIFLQPSGLSESTIESFYEKAQIDFVIKVEKSIVSVISLEHGLTNRQTDNGSTWLLATSGTTGIPKLVSYSLDSLLSTSKFDLEKGAKFTWGLCYDLNRFAGLQVYFQSISSGSSLVISEKEDSLSFLIKHFASNAVNALSATPSLWRQILMSKDSYLLDFNRITLGGEIAEQSILDALKLKFSEAKIIHIYASTEAGVGFSVKDGTCGFPVSFLNSLTNQTIEMKVINEHLWLKSQRGASSMLIGNIDTDTEGFIDSGDIVKVTKQRVLFIGRSSGAINVGGNKVLPEEIEKVLNSSEHVLLSRVSGKISSMLGMLVNVEIELSEKSKNIDKKHLKSLIIEHCKINLENYKIPAIIKFVQKISVNESGKIVRK